MRVFLSHTAEFGGSGFLDAAKDAVTRARGQIVEMKTFPADGRSPAEVSAAYVPASSANRTSTDSRLSVRA